MEQQHGEQLQNERGFTLADFVNALVRRWPIFTIIIIAFLIAGFISFRTRPPEPFVYRTTVEIGSDAKGALFEPSESVRAKFRESYIPETLAAHAEEHAYADQRFTVELIGAPGTAQKGSAEDAIGSTIIALLSRGGVTAKPDILAIHQRIVDRYLEDQERKIEVSKQALEQQQLRADLEREAIDGAIEEIPKRRVLIDAQAALLQKQLDAARVTMSTFEVDRSRALAAAVGGTNVDQSLATTLLIIDGNLFTLRDEVRTLEEQLFVQIPKDYAALAAEREKLKRDLRVHEQAIAEIAYQIANFHTPRILLAPSQLPRPPLSGTRTQTLAIFGGIGFILGLFVVAFVEFAVQVRREARRK